MREVLMKCCASCDDQADIFAIKCLQNRFTTIEEASG